MCIYAVIDGFHEHDGNEAQYDLFKHDKCIDTYWIVTNAWMAVSTS